MSVQRLEDMDPEERDVELDRIKDAVVGEQPFRTEVPDTAVTLFRGVFVGGRWYQDAHVKELTGADEEGIARMMAGNNVIAYVNAMVGYGVASIGPHDFAALGLQERMGILDTLLVGEKEWLLLHVLRVTYGDNREVAVRCPSCETMNDVSFSLTDDVPVRQLDDPTLVTYEFSCRDNTNIEYRLVTGADQAESSRRANLTVPETNTIILSHVIVAVNGKPLVDPPHYARNLGAFDRRNLLRELTSKQPGPYFEEVKLPCASCGAESTFTPGWADLL